MLSQTNEAALETAIVRTLVETHGYTEGRPEDYNPRLALDTARLWSFLHATQPEELAKLSRDPQWQDALLDKLSNMVKRYGVLHLLRRGLDINDAHLRLFYPPPLPSSSPAVVQGFAANQFSVTRQVRYSATNAHESIDLVVFVNGLPLITLEVKNPWTGQTARDHGIKQYSHGRDVAQPLLQFARCVVHFAIDSDEAYMATRLEGPGTVFLPFNKGHRNGKGNPVNPNGPRTAYVWQEILAPLSLANILLHFAALDGKPTAPLAKRNLIFPRYHQLEVVRKLLAHAAQNGVGQTYLIQHSAGSGKSNSITWAAYQLIELYPKPVQGASPTATRPLFDTVIVVTDRRVLDRQLGNTIQGFTNVQGIVARVDSSEQLRLALESGKKIVITTIQKFPFIVDRIADLGDKRFAIIIDEAHSSQSGTAADNLNQTLGQHANSNENELDTQDLILEVMQKRKMRHNASYFAFTATPKPATLERFGNKDANGEFHPFHLYSMKQAIEEGFILDVLSNYTTYSSYYEIEKSISDNPLFETEKAQKKLKKYVERHPETIGTKTEIVLEHFISKIVASKKLKGKAKGMVITQDIETAIRYFLAIQKGLQEKRVGFKAIVAFTGEKTVDGIKHTEDSLNGFPSSDIVERFSQDDYRLLVVANKFLTGFDEPKLCAMYVDKKLQGVLAVQALSRLNRAAASLGKKTEDLFVLDFYNSTNDIKEAFDPFYTTTSLSNATDVNILHELKLHLGQIGVYNWDEVEQFVDQFFRGADASVLHPYIDRSAVRFATELELDELEKADFKIKAKQFVKIYSQMAAILSFEVIDWEKLYWFLKFLIPKLILTDTAEDGLRELLESVDLSTYALERTRLNEGIQLDEEESKLDPQNPNPRGAYKDEQPEAELDIIVRSFNEKWFSNWETTPEEQRIKIISIASHIQNNPNYQRQVLENPDIHTQQIAFDNLLGEAVRSQRKKELEMYKLYFQDEAFRLSFSDSMRRILGLNPVS